MYLVGAPHPNRERLEAFLRYRPDEDYVTSAEVYQEILHRFVAIDRRRAIEDAFMLLDDLVVSVFPVQRSDVDAAREIAVSNRSCQHATACTWRSCRQTEWSKY